MTKLNEKEKGGANDVSWDDWSYPRCEQQDESYVELLLGLSWFFDNS
jgi:hypothetical protein